MENEVGGVVAADIDRAKEASIEPVGERQKRPQLVQLVAVNALCPIRAEVGQQALGRQVVQVLHEAEIVAEKVVVAADGWQADRKTHDDNRGARPPRGRRGRRGGDAVS